MYFYHIYLIFSTLILLFMIQTIYAKVLYLYTAGKDVNHVDHDKYGRKWTSPKSVRYMGKPWLVQAINKDNLIDKTPFYTAVLSHTLYSEVHNLNVSGRIYIRLYFYYNGYDDFDIVNANFSVVANNRVLTNFPKARAHLKPLKAVCLVYEYSFPVQSDELFLLLAPDYEHRDSFGFLNGVEFISHPDIYSGNATLVGKVKGRKFVIDKQTSLETIARLNVGGDKINIVHDSGKIFRLWDSDEGFIGSDYPGIRVDAVAWGTVLTYPPPSFTEHIAPRLLYRTARSRRPDHGHKYYKMMWRFQVDSKYNYLVRLHFCEVVRSFKAKDRVFDIHINGYLAEKGADVVAWTGKPGVPVFKDYVVFVSKSAKPEVRIVLTPNQSPKRKHYDTLLNGIEVFKLSDHNGDLDVTFNPFGNLR